MLGDIMPWQANYICGVLVNELRQIIVFLSRPHLIIEIKLLTTIKKRTFRDKVHNGTRGSI